jgi:hypothetical protein
VPRAVALDRATMSRPSTPCRCRGAKHAAPAVTRGLRRSRAGEAIDRVPAALDEPKLEVLQPDSA